MPSLVLRVSLGGAAIRRVLTTLLVTNLCLVAGTAAFNLAWAQREQYRQLELSFLKYVFVQTHLGTENVIAAWYSSVLLLAVAVAALIAYTLPRTAGRRPAPRWLRGGWLVVATVFAILSFDEIGALHERLAATVTFGPPGSWGPTIVLALPVVVTGIYLMAFAWTELRSLPIALRLFVAGVALFVWNPILQLFGTLALLAAVLLWLREHAPGLDASITMRVDPEAAARVSGIAALASAAGMVLSALAVRTLPAVDNGIPMNWFPAATAFLLCILTLAAREVMPHELHGLRRIARALAVLALVVSAYFGADIHGYTDWGLFDPVREVVRTTLAVGFAVACVVLSRNPEGGHIGALFVAAVLMAAAVNVTGPHAAVMAAWASLAATTGIAVAFSHLQSYSDPRISQRSGNAGRPSVI